MSRSTSEDGDATSDSLSEEEQPRLLARRVSKFRQFKAVLWKNLLLQTRISKAWYSFGAVGWLALLIEIAVPGIFFALTCIPKHYVQPFHFPQQLFTPHDLDSAKWAHTYQGPAMAHDMRAVVAFAPNGSAESAIMAAFMRSVSCPNDPSKKLHYSDSFYELFRQPLATPECADQLQCLSNPQCSSHLVGPQILGFGSAKEAVDSASQNPDTIDAVIRFDAQKQGSIRGYTVRVNHTEVPSTRARLNLLDVKPSGRYKDYWLFANLQLHLDRSIIGLAVNSTAGRPAVFNVGVKPFPWPAFMLDYGAAAASLAFNLLLVFAFLVPTRSMVSTIVREKELRLREGMRIFGLKDTAYWGSWAISHFATLALSMLICAVISLYPFRHSSFWELLVLLLLVALALISFAYCMSTLFSRSRVAGIAAAMLYLVSMVPGYLMPVFQPYGGWGWYISCIFPPSAVSLFAYVLLKVEAGGQGLQWDNLSLSVTSQSSYPFNARVVFLAIIFDIVFYALLAAYLDKVIPSEVGANLPWNFFLKRKFWKSVRASDTTKEAQPIFPGSQQPGGSMISVHGLRKVFPTTDGGEKVAVEDLNLRMQRDKITGLLGTNGAGKTTTISILTGMIKPTSGTAFVDGHSILEDMSAIRQNLGVCPQFDILWPDLTVREHLELYSAIKGYSKDAGKEAAISSTREVGLEAKLDSQAGDLSGGQRRKLSVAIAFLGSPAFVILDEPTSGMDPHSRRFTWEVIKRNKAGHAIILTTHSMEEADLLCDKIAIMAEGNLITEGSSVDLKNQFGVGYMLTIVKGRSRPAQESSSHPRSGDEESSQLPISSPHPSVSQFSHLSETDTELEQIIQSHISGASLVGRQASEIMFRLPKEERRKFPQLFRDLDSRKEELEITAYGIAETTLEEVFLAATQRSAATDTKKGVFEDHTIVPVDDSSEENEDHALVASSSDAYEGDRRRPERLTGAALYFQQVWALVVKRAISAKRDRLAVWTQLAVPILLVLVALLSGKATSNFPQEPSVSITREFSDFGSTTIFAASEEARANTTAYNSFLQPYPVTSILDSGESKLWKGPIFVPATGTLDQYLLDHWGSGSANYDAVFWDSWPNTSSIVDLESALAYTVLVNQTAIHAMPEIIRSTSSALLKAATGQKDASISVTNHPLPTLSHEVSIEVSRETGDILLVLFTIMASALISASFALFLVRERECASKTVQMISGAAPTAFWLATALWDGLSFCVPVLGIMICYAAFQIPQFLGARFPAFAALLFMYGAASLPLTYLLSFAFDDEMKALQWISSLYFLSGFLGFMATWILDVVYYVTHTAAVDTANLVTKRILRLFFPHFNLARGMYEVAATHHEATDDTTPWTWDAMGQWATYFAVQAIVYMALTLMIEAGWFSLLGYQIRRLVSPLVSCVPGMSSGPTEDSKEDDDVARERYRIQDGQGEQGGDQIVVSRLQKSYPQGCCKKHVAAVQGISFGVSQGECFGLLGANGAGKTTTFKILTGEVTPDRGTLSVAGYSVLGNASQARQNLGYCPQFSGLPGALTGREVLRMYARIRGMPSGLIEDDVQSLLDRLDLTQYADRACESYSGGNKRKLSVAVALVGDPAVVMMDEPSTGMDPGAKRFLWDVILKQVVGRGHTVLLTSHSMEECETLCSKLAIMRQGRLQCFGSVQHLKNKFGAGYVLEIRVAEELQYAVQASFKQVCPTAELTASSPVWMTYSLPQMDLDLAELFGRMEALKQSGVQEYSISQTTLEHVFVHLAQQQNS